MRYSLVLFLALLLSSGYSQQKFNIETCLSIPPNSNVLTVELIAESDSIKGLHLNIFDSHKRLVEEFKLPTVVHKLETKVTLSNIALGYYSYTITNGKEVIAKGEFNKDFYDEL